MTTFDNGRTVFRKSYIITENTRFSTQNYHIGHFVCHLAMLEGFDSFYNDVNYDKVTKNNMQLCALDEKPFNLKMLCQQRVFDIKLVDNQLIFILYL